MSKRIFAILMMLGFLGALAGCNTMHGLGQDIERGGEKIAEQSGRSEQEQVGLAMNAETATDEVIDSIAHIEMHLQNGPRNPNRNKGPRTMGRRGER
jgi:entericidin B